MSRADATPAVPIAIVTDIHAPQRSPVATDGIDTFATPLDRPTLLDQRVVGFEHGDPRAASFTMLRSQLLRRLDRAGGRVLAVTSPQPRNGKSFVAANLAAALSQIHPTCLVDLDLRRPSVHERFGLRPDVGVDDFLVGEATLTALDCRLGDERLAILPAREPRVNSADILAAERTATLFERLRALPGAPVCVIDTPPVLEGDDTIIVARHVDGVLLVVQEGSTRQGDLRETLRLLQPTPILGSLLNRSIFPQTTSSYGYYRGYRPA